MNKIEREKLKVYTLYSKKTLWLMYMTIPLVASSAFLVLVKVLSFLVDGGALAEEGSAIGETVLKVMFVYGLVIVSSFIISLYLNKKRIKMLDKEFEFKGVEGYTKTEGVRREEKFYVERVNRLCKKKRKELVKHRKKEIEMARVGELGLTEKDLVLAGELVKELKEDIDVIGRSLKHVPSYLMKIDVIRVLRNLERELEYNPKRIVEIPKLVYEYIPDYKELVEGYIKVNKHKVKDDKTKRLENKSEELIEEMARLIKEEYDKFKDKDMKDLEAVVRETKGLLG